MPAQLPRIQKNPTRKHIFISYASADRAAVADLHQRLKADYLPVWIDNLDVSEGLKAGQPWQDGLAEAMHAATCVVWMASPASIRSEWVRAELRRALELGTPILPYVLDADFATQPEWDEAKAWATLDGVPFGDVQRIMPANLGDDLAYKKLASQLREQVRAAKLTGVRFPSSALEIPISGRDDDLSAVETLLSEQRRLVVVMGVGGTGKTRLAAEIANRQRRFAHGVIWHKIESYTREEELTAQIRDHLTLPTDMHPDEVWTVLGRHSVLIVLDNAESCADIPAYAARLQAYDMSNGTRFLMTSRFQWSETRLINRAYELAVPTLEAAAQIVRDMAAHHGDPAKLQGREAELAQAARLHPRLIQYAVAWLNADPISEVLKMLQTLKGGADIEAVMHDILHKTLAQIETQPGGAQAVADLKKLLVCRGGFTSAAANALLGDTSRQSREVLRRWSLLKLEGERYTPDVLVEAALPADDSVRPAHYDYYMALAKNHDERQDYAGLDPDSANLTAAYDWAMEAGEYEKALGLLNASYHFLLNRGRVHDFMAQAHQVSAALSEHPDKLVWARSQINLGNAYSALATLEDRSGNLRRAIACYQATLKYQTRQSTPLEYAITQNNLGIAYSALAEMEDREANLRRAVECYQCTLQYQTPQSAPLGYADTQNNLGSVYTDLASIESRADNLRRAVECYEAALVYRTPEAAPLSYANTQNNLGGVYTDLASIENRADNLRRAIACYQEALVYNTPEAAPLNYAATQNNLGNAYSDLADVEDRADNLRRAVACYEAALVYRTSTNAPLGYADTQNNLGGTYYTLADVEDRADNLRRAVACFECALEYRTPEAAPLDYATTQNNLGVTYSDLAELEDRAGNLRRAVACYEATLVYRTSTTAPLGYADTQGNLGTAHLGLAEVENHEGNLHRAIACYQEALTYNTPESAPLGYAMTQNNLGDTYRRLADIEDRAANLHRAIACHEVALVHLTPQSAPLDYAGTQNNLGVIYRTLAALEDRADNLRRAVACYQAAMVYWTPDAAPLDYAKMQYNLGWAYKDLKDKGKARTAFQEAERYFRQMGDIERAELAWAHQRVFGSIRYVTRAFVQEFKPMWKSCLISLLSLFACVVSSLFSVVWAWNNVGWVAGLFVLAVVAEVWWALVRGGKKQG